MAVANRTLERYDRLLRGCSSRGANITLGKRISGGSFGTVYAGYMDGARVAVKIERIRKSNTLRNERDVYDKLHESQEFPHMGIPRCQFYFSDHERYRLMVLPHLGCSLKEVMLRQPKGRLSPRVTGLIALQLLYHLEHVHGRGFVSRDIKPANLLFGAPRGLGALCVYLVDFGLGKLCICPKTGRHIPDSLADGFTGTLRYCGIPANEGHEASRRDDLQSLVYMLVYMMRGTLPWQKALTEHTGDKYVQCRRVVGIKKSTAPRELCAGLPSVYRRLAEYAMPLGFEENIDYRMLKREFWTYLADERGEIDWSELERVVVLASGNAP